MRELREEVTRLSCALDSAHEASLETSRSLSERAGALEQRTLSLVAALRSAVETLEP